MANLRNVIQWEWLVFKTLLYLTLPSEHEKTFGHMTARWANFLSWRYQNEPGLQPSPLRGHFTQWIYKSIWSVYMMKNNYTHTHTLLSKFTHQPFELLLALQEVNNVKLKHHNKRKVDKPRTVCDPSLRSCVRHKNVSWSPSLKKYTSIGG